MSEHGNASRDGTEMFCPACSLRWVVPTPPCPACQAGRDRASMLAKIKRTREEVIGRKAECKGGPGEERWDLVSVVLRDLITDLGGTP